MKMTVMVCRFCGSEREIRAKEIGRITTCGAPECVHRRRVEAGSKPKGQGAANPRYRDGRWTMTDHVCAVCDVAFVGYAKRLYCSDACAAIGKARTQRIRVVTPETRAKMSASGRGRPKPEAWKDMMSQRLRGAANPNWLGGRRQEWCRSTRRYATWQRTVFERDGFACRICGRADIVAHHIEGWHERPDLRYVIENGVALCKSCHVRVHRGSLMLELAAR